MRVLFLLAVLGAAAAAVHAGEIFRLGPENWSEAPGGKEVDAIYGDYLVRNDRVVAVIADTVPGRNANVSLQNVQGCVIDFTLREANNDQLTAFLAQGQRWHQNPFEYDPAATQAEIVAARGQEVHLRVRREPTPSDPVEVVTDYVLRDGEPFLRIVTRHRNTGAKPFRKTVSDKMRCDKIFTQTPKGAFHTIVFYNRWFRAAYGLVRIEGSVATNGRADTLWGADGGTWIDYPDQISGDDRASTTIEPGREIAVTRFLVAGRHPADVQRQASALLGHSDPAVTMAVTSDGQPVADADIAIERDGSEVTTGFTDANGKLVAGLAPGDYRVTVSQIGRLTQKADVHVAGAQEVSVAMGPRSQVRFDITDGSGRPSPCKAQFLGAEGAPDPDLGPVERADGCKNLYLFAQGKYVAPLPPGKYRVVLSRGPEYDAVYRDLELKEGETVPITAQLRRVVDSAGWIAADFHNHTTESGDNVSEPNGRIVSIVAEGIEFAVCTEHNRIQSFRPRIRALGLEPLLATSDGIELSGRPGPLPLNHQTGFPLRRQAGAQDGGAPKTDYDPAVQIKRLFDYDNQSEKLVQQNHPDVGWLYFDKDGDGQRDAGFGTAPFTHVMEVRLEPKDFLNFGPAHPLWGPNRFLKWLQLLNEGFRLYGVTNSDAHTCFHESGRVRNYVKSSTDDPARIDEMEMAREAKRGHLVMSNGPFMEVTLDGALPGDQIAGRADGVLHVRVQCANWQAIDRVQVLVNGRPDPQMNFTRASHLELFHDAVVQFEHHLSLRVPGDAHVIVAAVGEKTPIAPVMGRNAALPFAVSNPIFLDVDGNGFEPNHDALGAPLAGKAGGARRAEEM